MDFLYAPCYLSLGGPDNMERRLEFFFRKAKKYLKLKTRKKAGLFPGTFIFIS